MKNIPNDKIIELGDVKMLALTLENIKIKYEIQPDRWKFHIIVTNVHRICHGFAIGLNTRLSALSSSNSASIIVVSPSHFILPAALFSSLYTSSCRSSLTPSFIFSSFSFIILYNVIHPILIRACLHINRSHSQALIREVLQVLHTTSHPCLPEASRETFSQHLLSDRILFCRITSIQ
ncbi:hypothetical protein AGLY_017177 [Aphis glycines]|uniref:Uncharacterized protein n=1 Tax=Aphis glycines TaxID=307491 RepID=A0A6G0SW85_APHGL|nr:hypothetical protein AGLY_017177 [Aphis glycines]